MVGRLCAGVVSTAEGAPVAHCQLVVQVPEDACTRALADIRQRIAAGERSPVLARHITAVGLDDILLDLARAS